MKKNFVIICGGLIFILGMCLHTIIFHVKNASKEKSEVQYTQESADIPEYYVEDKDNLYLEEEFNLSNYYISNLIEAANYYYIDDEQILWGYGSNEYGQLSNGKQYTVNNGYTDVLEGKPQKIAEDVVHVDMGGSYFAIYLTKNGELYGMGANLNGLMGMEQSEEFDYFLNPGYVVANKAVLLMKDVSYARCGDRNIVVLKKDGSVWWWGEFRTTSSKTPNGTVSVGYSNPIKLLDDAVYVSNSSSCAGAIKKDGSLWVWGNNTFGSLGVESENDDFIKKPVKVLDDVKMVWFDSMEFNSYLTSDISIYAGNPYECDYPYVTFAEKKNGDVVACGLEVTGSTYSEFFTPIKIVEKNRTPNLKFQECKYGWSPEELADYLNNIGVEYRVVDGMEDGNAVYYFVSLDEYYHFLFNEKKELYAFEISAYGSRDGSLKIGMEESEVEKLLGKPLEKKTSPDNDKQMTAIYLSGDIYYRLGYYDERVYVLYESNTKMEM